MHQIERFATVLGLSQSLDGPDGVCMAITNVPIQLTSFVGRERELAEVQRLLSTSRLVTLSGAGGYGKTRLAIQIAKTVGDRFTDGVWVVDLPPLREPALVPQLVVQTLGLHPPPTQPLLESLVNFVRDSLALGSAPCGGLVCGMGHPRPPSSRYGILIVVPLSTSGGVVWAEELRSKPRWPHIAAHLLAAAC
jgi:hypothetical protein